MSDSRLDQVRDAITSQVFAHWWCRQRAETEATVPHLRAATAAVLCVRGRVVGPHLPGSAASSTDENYEAEAKRVCAAPATGQTVERCLAQYLRDSDNEVRTAAVWAVHKLGGAATRAEILDALAPLLRESHSDVREAAAETVEELGIAVATSGFLTALAQLLQDRMETGESATVYQRVAGLGVRFVVRGGGIVAATVAALAQVQDE